MLTERFMAEARSLRFYEAVAMTRTKEIVALADWGYQYCLISHFPLPDIPVFLQQSCFSLKNAEHDVPDAPPPDNARNSGYPKETAACSGHTCAAFYSSGPMKPYTWRETIPTEARYESRACMVQYMMMRMNSRTTGETAVTWRDVVKGTPWLKERKEFSAAQEAAPAEPNELEREMEAWWQVEVMRKKCAARLPPATTSATPPDAPPNTPATDAETTLEPESGTEYPAGACFQAPTGHQHSPIKSVYSKL